MERKSNFQNLAWLFDLHQRGLLDMDPPYQRRSVWNEAFRAFFVDTVLLNYPCPAIFLYEDMSPEGVGRYKVVDGKQRLTTLFNFVKGEYAVPDTATTVALHGRYFNEFSADEKLQVWRYSFGIEYIPNENEPLINDIFDRINRNVARLTRQELRHAKYDGLFMTEVERLSEWMFDKLPKNVPSLTRQSKAQMKDTEFVGNLLLYLEEGVKSYSQYNLDIAYNDRDEHWEAMQQVVSDFTGTINLIDAILTANPELASGRLKNQADFYSMFAALHSLRTKGKLQGNFPLHRR